MYKQGRLYLYMRQNLVRILATKSLGGKWPAETYISNRSRNTCLSCRSTNFAKTNLVDWNGISVSQMTTNRSLPIVVTINPSLFPGFCHHRMRLITGFVLHVWSRHFLTFLSFLNFEYSLEKMCLFCQYLFDFIGYFFLVLKANELFATVR